MHHVVLVDEQGAEVGTTGRQNRFVGLEIHSIHHEGAVTQQAHLALLV